MTAPREFKALKAKPLETSDGLESFATPHGVTYVKMESDEVTSLCPITGQPDYETITIEYGPRQLCIESKSLKLFFQSLREQGAFIEDLASSIARLVADTIEPEWVIVSALQKPRGGIGILASATLGLIATSDKKTGEVGIAYVPMMAYPRGYPGGPQQ